ncbi:Palmitoyltransferase erf2 [Endocarpon pusillum Z07020]|uniref:Palmitoyltransferase n=1 Tax=Endocarpon pusillum (strain Z07020 / HMAS-L-300199) TaxID=1263415 RepID=U1G046_ENDPU|nr:Palmitoyltransferase erf2 [Endocarpon pusillum Z07020]ERF70572.1 Palmitoyltransferase erf2 [Endocarpon pusillum Z07020]
MSYRPSTAQSAISSELSDDEDISKTKSKLPSPLSQSSAPPEPSGTQLRGPTTLSALVARNNARNGTSTTASSRPDSPVSHVSKSHVPSLAAQGFFRPMSSQHLQAQRLGRPGTAKTGPSISTEDGTRDYETDTRRSLSTIRQERQGSFLPVQEQEKVPLSSGIEASVPPLPDRATNANPRGNTSRSLGDSVRLLNERASSQRQSKPIHLNLPKGATQGDSGDPALKSPRSFRSGLSLGSRRGSRQQIGAGHQHLPSNATSTRFDSTQNPTVVPETASPGKNYEYFEGNTVFCWGGRFQNARDRPVNIATGILLVLPAVLFFAISAPWLWRNVSPAIPIVFAYLFFISLSSFIHASLVDPGVFPRSLHPFPPPDPGADPLALGPPMNDWVMIRLATSDTAAMDVPVKYCKSCNIWRPPRCYHCRVCDNCVETLDHHCVWLNNCVGRRNYRYFFSFVSSATLLGLLLIGASLGDCLAYRDQRAVSFGSAINQRRIPFAMFVYGLLVTPYPASLWGYHLFLMGRGETTREYLNSHKFVKADRHRPFTQGNILKNWIAVLGRPRPPTYLHFKKKYEEGDQRFGPRRGTRQASLVEEAEGGMEMKPVRGRQKAFEGPVSRKADPPRRL